MEDHSSIHDARSRRMAATALILAFASIPLFFLFYISIPLAAAALLLALLSRGNKPLQFRGKMAVFVASVSIGLSGFVTISTAVTLYHSPDLRHQLEQMLEYYDRLYEGDTQSVPDLLEQYRSEPEEDREKNSVPQWNLQGGQQI